MTALIAAADWAIGTRASLGPLYILPMITAALALSRLQVLALALLCSLLRWRFDLPAPPVEAALRFAFAFIGYSGTGLFVIALAGIRHERELRQEAEHQLRILVESSPAAILTVDGRGVVLAANRAADNLVMTSPGSTIVGRTVGPYLPVLADALQFDSGPDGLRTSAQCQGFRENGEIFLANTWFSSWNSDEGKRLAAIVVDSSEEMRDREEESLRHLELSNRIAAAAVAHEVRNLCAAISVVSANLRSKHEPDDDFQALTSLVTALEKIASLEPRSRGDLVAGVALRPVLDDLRIVIEPQWRETEGVVRWQIPHDLPDVLAERQGLLLAFLNLAQNSHRAVQGCPLRDLSIAASSLDGKVIIRFRDSGPGVTSPDSLFEPFQPAAEGTGLGLYISRAVVRSYGGDLRLDPADRSCVLIELEHA